jgi:hypothetical protein
VSESLGSAAEQGVADQEEQLSAELERAELGFVLYFTEKTP